MADFIELLNSSQYQCIFIKDEKSSYYYANDNYIQLMGLQNLKELRNFNDYDLSKNRQDADKYRALDHYALEKVEPLIVCESIIPSHNSPIVKTMEGKLYPLFSSGKKMNYVLGVVAPESKLLKLDFETLFKLKQSELDVLLIRRSYPVKLGLISIQLSKMEIRTLVLLLKGAQAGDIARELCIKQTTVESYLLNIKNKFSVKHKSELIQLVINHKVLEQIVL